MEGQPEPRAHVRSSLEILAAAALFSTAGAVIKACSLTGWQLASFRSGVAALAVLVMLPPARRAPTRRALAVAATYAVTMILFVMANKLTTAANAIFLQSTAPLYVLLLSPWLLREKIRARDVVFMVAIGLGMSAFFLGVEPARVSAPDPERGNLLAALAGIAWAFTVIGLRGLARTDSPAHEPSLHPDASGREPADRSSAAAAPVAGAVFWGNVLAFAACLPGALPVGGARPADWVAVAYLGVFQIGLAYVFLTYGMRHVGALEASLLLLLEPVLNPIWAWLVHGETPRPWALAGGAIILLSTVVRTWLDAGAQRA